MKKKILIIIISCLLIGMLVFSIITICNKKQVNNNIISNSIDKPTEGIKAIEPPENPYLEKSKQEETNQVPIDEINATG